MAVSNNESASLWQPLRSSTFRNLLLADVVSDVGTFMQSVGAAWLMVSLNAGPMYVALTQTASALPFFLLALPAGAIGDIVDRRKVILFTETWMLAVASVLAVMTKADVLGVDGAKHLWVGEKYVRIVLSEIVRTVNPAALHGAAALPAAWDG